MDGQRRALFRRGCAHGRGGLWGCVLVRRVAWACLGVGASLVVLGSGGER